MWPSRIDSISKVRAAVRHLAAIDVVPDTEEDVAHDLGYPSTVSPNYSSVKKAAYYTYDGIQALADERPKLQAAADAFEVGACSAETPAALHEALVAFLAVLA